MKTDLCVAFCAGLVGCVAFGPTAAHAQSTPPTGGSGAAVPGDDTAGQSNTDIAKKIQNPIGDLYSFPFQSNTNFGFGPHGGTQESLNIQPVIRFTSRRIDERGQLINGIRRVKDL